MLFEKRSSTALEKVRLHDNRRQSSKVFKQKVVKHYEHLKRKMHWKNKTENVGLNHLDAIQSFYSDAANLAAAETKPKKSRLFFCDELDMCQNGILNPSNIWRSSAPSSRTKKAERRCPESPELPESPKREAAPSPCVSSTRLFDNASLQDVHLEELTSRVDDLDSSPSSRPQTRRDYFTNKNSIIYPDSHSVKHISDYLSMINEQSSPPMANSVQHTENTCCDEYVRSVYEDSNESEEDCLSFEVNTIDPPESPYSSDTNITPSLPLSDDEASNRNRVHEINSGFSSISGRSIENLIEQIFDIPSIDANPRNISSIYFEMTIDILETTYPSDGKLVE